MARDRHWPLSRGDPAPGHTAPQSQFQGLGNPHTAGRGPGNLLRDGAVSGPQWTVGAIYSLYLLSSLSRAQVKTHPGILRPLPQREGTAHPAAQSLKSCTPTHPTLPPPHSPPFPHPHPLASCSLGTAPRQTLLLSRCPHAWASPPGGGVGWFLKGPVQHPLLPQQGSLGGQTCFRGEKDLSPLTPTRYPPLLHIFCVWPPCKLERDRGGVSRGGFLLSPQALEPDPGTSCIEMQWGSRGREWQRGENGSCPGGSLGNVLG